MVRETTVADIRYVCAYMRAFDAVDQFALRECDDQEALATDLIAAMPRAIMSFCFVDGHSNPATILSAYLISPGVARLHRLSTNVWPKVSCEVFRFGIERFMPALAASVHRAECSVLACYPHAGTILSKLGFVLEGTSRARGRAGEDFSNFAWVRS